MNKKGFHQIQWEDRLTIEKMLKIKTPKKKIAEALGVCERTIYYEIKRGLCVQQINECDFEERYCPEVAERRYQENLRAKGPDLKIGRDLRFAEYVERKIIDEGYSPGAVLGEIQVQGLEFDTDICESTLYNYIYREDVFLELSPEHLHEKGRRHTVHPEKQQAVRASRGENIERRPAEVNERTTFGHWEMDSVMGTVDSQKSLLVLIERLTRMCLIFLLPDHTMASVVRVLNGLERRFGKDFYRIFKSITVDNGCEFMDCDGMEKARRRKGKRTRVYYCHPYTPSERGSGENVNRMVRRFFPKGTSFDGLDATAVRRAETWINNYPRRLLGWRSAGALFSEYLAV